MRRGGATLVEVLVAIFVMALGMLALLTLFPLGALRMDQAIQDDRTALCGYNASSIATMKNIRNDTVVVYGPGKSQPDVFAADLDDAPFAGQPGPLPAPDVEGPSNAVIVDPAGVRMSAGLPSQNWIGGIPGLLPRRTTSFDGSPADTYRWFSFLDDYEFERIGGLRVPGEASFPVTRDYVYSWAYLLQRPRTSDASVVNCSVMVFRRRPMSLTSTLNLREFVYQPSGATLQLFDVNRNVVTIDHTVVGEPPPIRPGNWIMDASLATSGGKRLSHAFFYRVVSVTEISDTQTEVEVQTPLRGFDARFPVTAPGVYEGTVVIFDGLVEVFERGAGWK